ncbi:MAG: DUF167 domain-containing protein [Gemmatimonadetes bacterium]|nr:DUF167 domain-containing protein [Gemmatimonadota bacterium]
MQPRASRSGIDGIHGDALKVRVQAPPVDGAANAALVTVLAEALGVREGAVQVVAGLASRIKVVEVLGVTRAEVLAALR